MLYIGRVTRSDRVISPPIRRITILIASMKPQPIRYTTIKTEISIIAQFLRKITDFQTIPHNNYHETDSQIVSFQRVTSCNTSCNQVVTQVVTRYNLFIYTTLDYYFTFFGTSYNFFTINKGLRRGEREPTGPGGGCPSVPFLFLITNRTAPTCNG